MLVGFGQTVCLPVNPRCDLCHLGQMEDSPCPSKRKVFVKQALAKKEEEETRTHILTGEIGLLADTELEVEETEVKPIIEVKAESVIGHLDSQSKSMPGDATNASSYFNAIVKKEENSLAW